MSKAPKNTIPAPTLADLAPDKPDTKPDDTLRVIALDIQAFKGVRAVRLQPNGRPVVEIAGNNGAGKSSVLDGIMACLTGGRMAPDMPIRRGHTKARCWLTLGGKPTDEGAPDVAFTVERVFTPGGGRGGRITITDKDGKPISEQPSAWLARMFGDEGCDPLAFARMRPAEQIEVLKNVTGLASVFAKIQTDKDAALQSRRDADGSVTRYDAQLRGMQDVEGPDEEVTVGDLAKQLTDATTHNLNITKGNQIIQGQVETLAKMDIERAGLEEAIHQAQEDLKAHNERAAALHAKLEANKAKMATIKPVDTTALQEKITGFEKLNAIARGRVLRRQVVDELAKARESHSQANRKVEALDADRRNALVKAKLPVVGLTFDDNEVKFDGIPFQQVNTAMQIRVGAKIALAAGRPIRVLFVQEGALLDEAGMKALYETAEEMNAQAFVERLEASEAGGVVIEDGEVKA